MKNFSFIPPQISFDSETVVKEVCASNINKKNECIFLDIETTGLNDDGTDEILEIAIVDAIGNTLLNTLIRPELKKDWIQAQAIHGIRPEDVTNAPSLKSILPEIVSISQGKTVVSYNAPFDASFFPSGFFGDMRCAMRRFAEINPDSKGWVKLSEAASLLGFIQSEKYHRAHQDALACRYIWVIGIPKIEQEYPLPKNSNISATLILENGKSIQLFFNSIFPDQLRFLSINDECKFWTKNNKDDVNIYRPRTLGGGGKIASFMKIDNPELAEFLSSDFKVKMKLKKWSDDGFVFEVMLKRNKRIFPDQIESDLLIDYSPIDDDIYNCFIAERSGMCDAIGTWEVFREIEEKIAKICIAHGGNYFKSNAKRAKFAIIFSPSFHNVSGIFKWQQKGFKVTTFDQVLKYFDLEKMWDCPNYLAHIKNLSKHQDS